MLKIIVGFLLVWNWSLSGAFAQNTVSGTPTVNSKLKAKEFLIKLISGEELTVRSLDSLKENNLYVTVKKRTQLVSTDLINTLSVAQPKRLTLKGLGLGVLSGAVLGAVIGRASYSEEQGWLQFSRGFHTASGAVAGSLVGALVGTIIGASSYRYKHYDLSTLPLPEKQVFMSSLLAGKLN